nr:uncharacterized protein LOC111420306 [Onthophagus taurus]XP_022909051.1 uncharacterized protein LOC111420306 [Onthophagus taurus]
MGSSQSQSSNKIDDSSSNTSDSEDSDDYLSVASDMEKPENLSQLTSDAAFTSRYMFHKPSMDEIGLLDNNLDINDKISLIYLLYDHPNKACEMLERSFDGVVKEWFKLEGQFIQEWHLKVLEALCIIKHFKGLKILGHNKADMTSTFLPFNKLVSVKVNKIRKALYCIFEDLQPNEVDQLFKILQQDILKKYISTILDKNNLELTFLHLEMSGYFSLINLTNLIFLFKQMDLLSVWEDFKMLQENICFSTHDQIGPPVGATSINWGQSANSSFMNDDVTQRNIDHYDNQYLQNVGEVQEKSTIQQSRNREICDIEDSYHVDPLKPGLLLIIDNENFYTENRQQFKVSFLQGF